MSTTSYWARGDNPNANNSSLNVSNTNQVPTTQITFVAWDVEGPNTGDTNLDFNLDPDSDGYDPNTRVYLNDESDNLLEFTVVFRGTLQDDPKLNGLGDPPGTNLSGAEITVIELETGERFFFVTNDPDFSFAPHEPNLEAFAVMEDFPKGGRKIDNLVVCFAAGTMIRTKGGRRAVETLKVGDQVRTETGLFTIRLISHRTITKEEMCDNSSLRPVVIPAGTLGNNMPASDLTLTGTHRIKVSDPTLEWMFGLREAFVQARDLPFARNAPIKKTTVVHFLCDEHVVVDANGCPSESLFPGDMALMALSPSERANYAKIVSGRFAQTAYPCLTSKEASVWRASLYKREKRTACVDVQ